MFKIAFLVSSILAYAIFPEKEELIRQARDSIGQNRLGNNLHLYHLHQGLDSTATSEYQLMKWMLTSKQTVDIDTLKNMLENINRSVASHKNHSSSKQYRLSRFRKHH